MILDGREAEVISPTGNVFKVKTPIIHPMEKNEETGAWEETEKYLTINDTLFNNLYFLKKSAKKYNGDILFVVDGEEGSGKSTFARQIAKFLDHNFTADRICYSTRDAMKLHYNLPAWSCIVLDESREDLDRKSTMSKKSKTFNNFLSESRVANKFFCLVLPSIYDLDKYSAQHRAKFLIHCYKRGGYKPGYFLGFSKSKITRLFATGYKYRNYPVHTKLQGTFQNAQVVDMVQYNEKKMEAFNKYREKLSDEPMTRDEIIRDFILTRLDDLPDEAEDLNKDVQAKIFGFTRQTIYKWQQEQEEKEKGKS